MPAETVAVLRFGGTADPAAVAAARERLAAALAGSAWRVTGPGGAWFYDPPRTLPPFRRNEPWAPVGGG